MLDLLPLSVGDTNASFLLIASHTVRAKEAESTNHILGESYKLKQLA